MLTQIGSGVRHNLLSSWKGVKENTLERKGREELPEESGDASPNVLLSASAL